MTRSIYRRTLLLGLCVWTVVGCSGPAAPSAGFNLPRTPTVLRLALEGPTTMAPGEDARVVLMAILSNGETIEITNEGVWTSSVTDILTVNGGLVSAHTSGEALVGATARGLTTSHAVIVVPSGTFRLIGAVIVSDSETLTSYPLVGGDVEIATPDGMKLKTTTDASGRFRVYGVAGRLELKVTKMGYVPLTRVVDVTSHQFIDFEIYPVETGGRQSGGRQ